MTANTIVQLETYRQSGGSRRSGFRESPAGHERRSSLPPHPVMPMSAPPAVSDDVEATAELVLAMENHPFLPTAVWVVRGGDDRRARVAVRVGDGVAGALLEPRDARFTADVLFDEQAFAGAAGVAERLHDAADRAERLNGVPASRRPRRFRSSHATLIGGGVIAAALFAAAAAERFLAVLGL